MMTKIKLYARQNRKNMTPPEKKFWYKVSARKQTGYKFLRQHPIGHFITDFYCRKLKLVIEIVADSHVFKNNMYHYSSCGLQNIWLKNSYAEHDTNYGKGISIHNVRRLK
ncbi:MAG: DUF559 domain-containing protein [Pseudomonadota bacterium]